MIPDILAASTKFRKEILDADQIALARMSGAYTASNVHLQTELNRMTAKIAVARSAGENVNVSWLYRQTRYKELIAQNTAELARFHQQAADITKGQQQTGKDLGLSHSQGRMALSIGPMPDELQRVGLTMRWNRPNHEAMTNLVGVLGDGTPLDYKFASMTPVVMAGVKDALIVGINAGHNPRRIAADVKAQYGAALDNSLVVCRTEGMRAYRTASHENYRANSDVVKGWVWSAAHQGRTCAACWGMDGTEHPIDEDLQDHPCGRCVAIPITKTWQELFPDADLAGIEETQVKGWDPEQYFSKLTPKDQLRVLGPTKFNWWSNGAIKLRDIPTPSVSKVWGTHYRPATLASLQSKMSSLPNETSLLPTAEIDSAIAAMSEADITSLFEEWFDYETGGLIKDASRAGKLVVGDTTTDGGKITQAMKDHFERQALLMQRMAETANTGHKLLYRGIPFESNDAVKAVFKVNQKITLDSLTAATPDRKIADIYTDYEQFLFVERGQGAKVILEIENADGVVGINSSVSGEVILPKGAEYRVIRVIKEEDGTYRVGLFSTKNNVLHKPLPASNAAAKATASVEKKAVKVTRKINAEELTQKLKNDGLHDGDTKAKIATDLAKRLDGNNVFEQYVRRVHSSATEWDAASTAKRAKLREKACADLVHQWAATSAGSSRALAIQIAAQEEFGLVNSATSHFRPSTFKAAKSEFKLHGAAYRVFLRAQYENTQAWFVSEGIDELVVFRGAGFEGLLDDVAQVGTVGDSGAYAGTVSLQPLNSFASDIEEAILFADNAGNDWNRVLIKTTIPRQSALSTCLTGNGCKSESEVVVLGGDYKAEILQRDMDKTMSYDSLRLRQAFKDWLLK